jgi:hypothetical protein
MQLLRNSTFGNLILILGMVVPSFSLADVDRNYWITHPKLTEAFNQSFERVPQPLHEEMLYPHHLWKQANCKKTCEKEALEKRIAFYERQPVKHKGFKGVYV